MIDLNLDEIKLVPIMDSLKILKINDEEYFGPQYKDYISNSRLKLINPSQDGSPEKYFAGFEGNKIYNDCLIRGSAVHELILQPDLFFMCDTVDRPSAKAGFIADIVYSNKGTLPTDEQLLDAAKEVDYYHGELNDRQMSELKDKIFGYLQSRFEFEQTHDITSKTPIYLCERERNLVYGCINNINANHAIQKLLHPVGLIDPIISENEQTILLDVEVHIGNNNPFIVKLKSKLDNYTIDTENNIITVNDIKTHGRLLNTFDDAVLNFHYYREMVMYSTLLTLIAKKYYNMENPTVKSNFLVVSTVPNYYTKVTAMTKDLFYKGISEFHELLKMVCHYTYYGLPTEEANL